MNRGSALKWVDHIKTDKFLIGHGQLRFDGPLDERYADPFGILCDFMNPDGWKKDWTGVGYTFEGETFFMPETVMKKCKIKTRECEFVTGNGRKTSLVDVIDSVYFPDWAGIIQVIETHYEQF